MTDDGLQRQMVRLATKLEETRSDLVTARQEVRKAIGGDDADLSAAAGLIDQALASLCPHDPMTHYHSTSDSGEELVTCPQCGVSCFTGERMQ